jgi:hypothetical protein
MNEKTKVWLLLGGVGILTLLLPYLFSRKKPKSSNKNKIKSDFKKKLVDLANKEWDKWNKNNKVTKEGSQDTIQDLRDYYEIGTKTKDSDSYYINTPWSATFISYLMREAGAGDDFKYNLSHSVYITEAIKNKLENNNKKFKGYKPDEVDVEIGDLVCYPRDKGITYNTNAPYVSHCDLITEINGNIAVGIGGNVSNSVSKKNYNLKDGKIDKVKSSSIFVVIKNLK